MTERAGRRLDARHLAAFRMAAKDRVDPAEPVKLLGANEALVGQERIEREAAVTFAENAAVAVRPVRTLRVVEQDVVVENSQDFDERHRGADMPAIATFEAPYDQGTQIPGARIKRWSQLGGRLLHMLLIYLDNS